MFSLAAYKVTVVAIKYLDSPRDKQKVNIAGKILCMWVGNWGVESNIWRCDNTLLSFSWTSWLVDGHQGLKSGKYFNSIM